MDAQRRMEILDTIDGKGRKPRYRNHAHAMTGNLAPKVVSIRKDRDFLKEEVNVVEEQERHSVKMQRALEQIHDITSGSINAKSRKISQLAATALNISLPECFMAYPEHEDPYQILCASCSSKCPDTCSWKKR